MAKPTFRTNLQFVLDCLYYNLGQISNANGFRTDGYAVVRGGDPRLAKGSNSSVFSEKLAAISLKIDSRTRVTSKSNPGSPLGRATYRVVYDYLVLRTLSQTQLDQDVTVEDLETEIHDDIDRLFARDGGLVQAAQAVFAAAPAGTYTKTQPHIVDHKFEGIHHPGQFMFPDAILVARASFEYSDHPPR